MTTIIGIAAEYNPFHTGHLYQIQQIQEKYQPDAIVAVMSGNFVQRGEPAFFDKWTRTRMALLNGVDIVLELPVIYATAAAEDFADGAVQILEKSGIVNYLCFGSECGNIELLKKAAVPETEAFRQAFRHFLIQGMSYPAARSKAYRQEYGIELVKPNDILGAEYIRALSRQNSKIIPLTIKRIGNYNDKSLSSPFASGSALREGIRQEKFKEVLEYIPENIIPIWKNLWEQGVIPVFPDHFKTMFHYAARMQKAEGIKQIFEVSEGLENKIIESIQQNDSLFDVAYAVKSKRYTLAKIKRILMHILLQIKQSDVNLYRQCPYIRILGFRRQKQEHIARMIRNSPLPILANLKKTEGQLDERGAALLAMEVRATDIYFLGNPQIQLHTMGQDYTHPMVLL